MTLVTSALREITFFHNEQSVLKALRLLAPLIANHGGRDGYGTKWSFRIVRAACSLVLRQLQQRQDDKGMKQGGWWKSKQSHFCFCWRGYGNDYYTTVWEENWGEGRKWFCEGRKRPIRGFVLLSESAHQKFSKCGGRKRKRTIEFDKREQMMGFSIDGEFRFSYIERSR